MKGEADGKADVALAEALGEFMSLKPADTLVRDVSTFASPLQKAERRSVMPGISGNDGDCFGPGCGIVCWKLRTFEFSETGLKSSVGGANPSDVAFRLNACFEGKLADVATGA